MNELILTPAQMRAAEQTAVDCGIGLAELMESAGEALGREVLKVCKSRMKRNVLILVGSGNNGGDGFVAAKFLADSSVNVRIILCCGNPKTELAQNAAAGAAGLPVYTLEQEDVHALVDGADITVDCAFGTGFRGSIEGVLSDFLAKVNKAASYRIACDVPSGVNSLNGTASANTFNADETVTFHRGKLGLYISPAKDYCGEIIVRDIGIPDFTEEYAPKPIYRVGAEYAASLLPPRPENSHKGTFGRLTMICGSSHYIGAAMISARAALRSGVGIVNLCTAQKVISSVASAMPECTFTPLHEDENGFIDFDGNFDIILESLSRSSACLIGCGLGKTENTARLVCALVRNAKCPLIIDADGINCLSEHIDVLKEKQTEIILTPHAAELARLCGVDTAYILNDTCGYAQSLAEKYGVTIHAKNTQTITVGGDKRYLTDFGCSALAKGGSGDMLAGIIGSLIAQGATPIDACVLADYIMGTAARNLCRESSPRGILASDITAELPKAFYQAEQKALLSKK